MLVSCHAWRAAALTCCCGQSVSAAAAGLHPSCPLLLLLLEAAEEEAQVEVALGGQQGPWRQLPPAVRASWPRSPFECVAPGRVAPAAAWHRTKAGGGGAGRLSPLRPGPVLTSRAGS